MSFTGYSLRISIPGLTMGNSAANASHWVKTKAKEAMRQNVWVAMSNRGPAEPLEHAKIRITRCSSGKPPDGDNLYHGTKMILDALQAQGVIEDDKPACVGMVQVRWRKARPKRGSMIVEVFGCEAEDLDMRPWVADTDPWDGMRGWP